MSFKTGRGLRVVVCGTRYIHDHSALARTIENSGFRIRRIITTCAQRGVDYCASRYASICNIPCSIYSADWERDGNLAPLLRNCQMVEDAHAIIALWDGESPDTKQILHQAKIRRRQIYYELYDLK